MRKDYYVYIYIDPITRFPFYVGKGSGDRLVKHLKENKNNTENYMKWCHIKGLRNKGLEPQVFVAYKNLTEPEAFEREKHLISIYGRKNIDDGGILTNRCLDNRPPVNRRKRTDEEKRKISEFNKKYWKENPRPQKSDQALKRMSENMEGDKNPMFGKSALDCMIDKYGEEEALTRWKKRYESSGLKNKGRPKNIEAIEKNRAKQKGLTNVNMRYIVSLSTGVCKKIHKDELDTFLEINKDWKRGRKL